jgi:sigma-B regulation protein RsbU (phosphoserine phosphatase)
VSEILDKHREIFESLASGWMRVGASCVQLLKGDEVLVGCPNSMTGSGQALSATSRISNLTLRVYGIADSRWIPTVESMLDIFASLLSADTDLDSLTAALVETQDRLVALYELTQATRRTLDVPILLDLLIQQSKHLMDVDGGFVILREKGRKSIIHQVSENPLHPAHVEAAATLFQRDPNRHIFKDSETLPAGLRNVMMVSLPVREEISAAVGLFNKTGSFTTPDIKLAQAIAGHIGAQLENAMLHKEAVERTRLETEMAIARQVQTAILPQTLPSVEGLDIYATSIPAFEVGGDFFDITDRSNDLLFFALGDVTGKGMPAALLMSMTHTIIKAASRNMPFTHPHQILNRLNHDMAVDFSNVGMFTTVMLGLVDCASRKLHFSNAGQSPIYYIPANGEPALLEAQDIPVGILDTTEYSTQNLSLSNGDVFIAATDGFPESRNPSGDMYGYERMNALISSARQLPAEQIAEALLADVNAFCGTHPQDDDRTIIVIKFEKQDEKKIMFNESLTVRADYKEIREPCGRLRALLKQAKISEETANLCELALQELLTNLVDHAYKSDPNGQIIVRMAGNREQVFIQTEDTGIPANVKLDEVHMPDPAELAEGGYGMAIIQSLMDEVKYFTSQGTNTWRLVKKLK